MSKRRKRFIDFTVPEAASVLHERYGRERAQCIASNRYDTATTEATATFYEQVHTELRDTTNLRRYCVTYESKVTYDSSPVDGDGAVWLLPTTRVVLAHDKGDAMCRVRSDIRAISESVRLRNVTAELEQRPSTKKPTDDGDPSAAANLKGLLTYIETRMRLVRDMLTTQDQILPAEDQKAALQYLDEIRAWTDAAVKALTTDGDPS